MNLPYDVLIRRMEYDDMFKEYAKNKYPTEYEYWKRFRDANGIQCPIARSAIKRMMMLSLSEKDPNDLIFKIMNGR